MGRRDGSPVWVSDTTGDSRELTRVDFAPKGSEGKYTEDWLQRLLFRHPNVFPIRQIEPGFDELLPACIELPLSFGGGKSGALDALFFTTSGNLVLVETKLWRNPEARRSVVAQALDYASAVFRMKYAELDAAVSRARRAAGMPPDSLFELASRESPELDEAEFVDSVSRNLERGKAVIAVVGDGIRGELVSLAELLQGHAGQRFTFALVELAIYGAPSSDERLVVPSILAQTLLLERGVIDISALPAQQVTILPPRGSTVNSVAQRGMSFGEDEFYDELNERAPGMADVLKTFVSKAATLGIYPEVIGGLNLKHASPAGNPLNVGAITKGGLVDFGPSTWWGTKEAARKYNETVAQLLGGTIIERKAGSDFVVRIAGNKMPRLSLLLPKHEQAWLDAIEQYIKECVSAAKASEYQ
jgi:hypothetical protein